MFQNLRRRSARRGWPIMGYVGPNGGGKTAAMVWDTLPSLEAGRPVLSTVRILDYLNPRPCDDLDCPHPEHALDVEVTHRAAHPLWIPFTGWEQLLNARGMDVLMDEVTGVGSSRESQSMPAPVANALVQQRRADNVIRWSAPAWARADKIIRECSQAVTYCRGYMPVRVEGDGGDRSWRTRRMFKWTTYDASEFEDFTVGKREALSGLQVDWHWGPGSPVFSAYDTFDAVSSIGTVTDSGRCYRCGGTRRIPACSCPKVSEGEAVSSRGPAQRGATGRVPAAASVLPAGSGVATHRGHALDAECDH